MEKGFSLIEILMVVAIVVILAAGIFPSTLNLYQSQQLESQTQGIIQTLRRAQLKAISIESDAQFGVYITDDNYTLFRGDSYLGRDPQYDEVNGLPGIITAAGLSEVVFSKFEGEPNQIGDVILSNSIESRTININTFGVITLAPSSAPAHLAQLHYRWRVDDGGE